MLSNIGITEFLLIAVVALVLFGPKKLPEIGRAIGKAVQEFKNSAREILEDKPAPIDKPTEVDNPTKVDNPTDSEAKSVEMVEDVETVETAGSTAAPDQVEVLKKRESRLVTDNPRRLPD